MENREPEPSEPTPTEPEAFETACDEAIAIGERFYFYAEAEAPEGEGSEEMPARLEGLDAVLGKHGWWYEHHEVHSSTAEGPYVGFRDDQFAVRFLLDVTPKGGERAQMEEVALYTACDGKITREEFLYRMG